MTLPELRPLHDNNPKRQQFFQQFRDLIDELKTRGITGKSEAVIREGIEAINSSTLTGNELRNLVRRNQFQIARLVEKEHKIVPKKYYLRFWLLLGMTAFGLPLGTVFGLSMGNMGLMGLGLPIGMGIGAAVGSMMDKKAADEGRQLDLELKY